MVEKWLDEQLENSGGFQPGRYLRRMCNKLNGLNANGQNMFCIVLLVSVALKLRTRK